MNCIKVFNTHLFGKFLGHQWKINIQCYLVIPPPFGPEKSLAVSEGGGTMREHSYAWTRELAMNLLNGKDDGYKGMLNLCTYVNVLFDNLKFTDKSFSYSINHLPIAMNSLITQSACVYLDLLPHFK